MSLVWIVFKGLGANNVFIYLFITQVRLKFYFKLRCLLFILSLDKKMPTLTMMQGRQKKPQKIYLMHLAFNCQNLRESEIKSPACDPTSSDDSLTLVLFVPNDVSEPGAAHRCHSMHFHGVWVYFCVSLHLLGCLQHCLFPQGAQCDFSLCSKTKCLLAKTSSVRSSSWNHWISVRLHVYTVRLVKAWF